MNTCQTESNEIQGTFTKKSQNAFAFEAQKQKKFYTPIYTILGFWILQLQPPALLGRI
jgi:hypothetical protein